jgi:putative addiction module component (TIGR02574 family)
MTKAAEALLREAMKLGVMERADRVAQLLASLDGEPAEDVRAAWDAEIQQRIERIDAGAEKLLPWDDVERRLDEALQKQ